METEQVVLNFNEQLQLLEGLIIRSDYEKVKVFFNKVRTYCKEKGLTKTKLFKLIASHLICAECKMKVGKVVLNCKHSYCEKCLKKIVEKQKTSLPDSNNQTYDFTPRCIKATCEQPIEQEKYQYLFKDLISARNSPVSLDSRIIVCKNCSKPHNIKYFAFNCGHVCIFCESFHINQGQTYCSLCDCEEFSRIFLDSIPSINCSVCGSNKIIEEHFSFPCPEHIHCFNCLQVAWSINKCLKCKQSLSPTVIQSYSILYKECDYCENHVLATFIYPKLCCRAYICKFCQSNYSTCLFCSSPLNYI